jgi:tryptophan synthase alpha chain
MNYKIKFNQLKRKREKALIGFTIIGDPDYRTSLDIVKTMIESGVDILELGFPFSDPIADGPVIQAADIRALSKGANTDKNFKFISDIRKFTDVPIGLLVYSNLIYQSGINDFYSTAYSSGVNSILVADLPIEEAKEFVKSGRRNKVDTVFIISQLSYGKRLCRILKNCRGFVYLVSRLGVTGVRQNISLSAYELVRRIKRKTKLPLCVGFGISRPEHVRELKSDGVIVGSAIVKIIEKNLRNKARMLLEIKKYIKSMKNATL